jgi:MscS family membrane protein
MTDTLNDTVWMGLGLAGWGAILAFLVGGYVAAWLLTWPVAAATRRRMPHLAEILTGPVRVLVWLAIARTGIIREVEGSEELGPALEAGTLVWIALAWSGVRLITLAFDWWSENLKRKKQTGTALLLRPLRNLLGLVVVLAALLSWLHNLGFNIGAVLAGLGVGGLAVALAAQDTLRNFIGSLMILIDRSYRVGDRIVARGHDGIVEEIGLRSTKIRQLDGHLTTIPNADMAAADIESIGQRPHIVRKGQVHLALDTSPDQVRRAVSIVKEALENHAGMEPDRPPRVHFDEMERDAFRVAFTFWYHPPDWWACLDVAQELNLRIIEGLRAAGIALAPPASRATVEMVQDESGSARETS